MRCQTYRILADGHAVNNDTWVSGLNNNDLIIGPSGAGKTRGYVKPNILQCSESLIITDTKGSLRQETGGVLEQHGYNVLEVNLADCAASPCGYNPLSYIRYDKKRQTYHEQDILSVSACLVPIESPRDAFWELAARMLLSCMIGYALEFLPDSEHTLCSVVQLVRELGNGNFERMMMEVNELAPNSFAATQYALYKPTIAADKMHASIMGILAEKLSILSFDGARALFQNPNQVHFPDLGREKTALFLTVSDMDRAMDRLAALFYSQALQSLCDSADRNRNHRLKVPVRLILDDFAAAADSCIPNFDQVTSVIRSREISVSVILQSLSQLEASYGHSKAMTIINNCDHLLYLGGQDVETAKYVSTKANKSINSILNMPLDHAWLFERGTAPQEVQKFRLENHGRYPELLESQPPKQSTRQRARGRQATAETPPPSF